jgi:hypothetical protein
VRLHPATLLILWGAVILVLQNVPVAPLAWLALLVLPASLFLASRRTRILLRRTRWLLLSIAILFGFAIPGERLPGAFGDLGMTFDGLHMAAEHVLRLVLLLASLALLHQHLGNGGFMAGLHWLLAPLSHWRATRERIIVRLMLVLDYVENDPTAGWRSWLVADASGPERLDLATRPAHAIDWLVIGALGATALLGWPLL